jgi:hypothetical protein
MRIQYITYGVYYILYKVEFKNEVRDRWKCYIATQHNCNSEIVIMKYVWYPHLRKGGNRLAYHANKNNGFRIHFNDIALRMPYIITKTEPLHNPQIFQNLINQKYNITIIT